MDTKQSQHGEWSSRLTFIMAATGSAVGLGNIWKFPYITGENGGGAFVLIYLLCVFLVAIPIMIAETMLGRRGRKTPMNTMLNMAQEAGADTRWQYVGAIGIVAGFLILSYYSVIAGWATAYVFKALSGSFFHNDAASTKAIFDDFVSSPLRLIFWHSLFMLATMLIVVRGISKGLEQSARIMMPGLFALMTLLLAYAMTTTGYFQGLNFLFNPDFSKLTGASVLVALGQAFFSLGLGMGSVMIYGAYLPKNISIAKTTIIVAVTDTLVALLAGLVIFPLVFSYGLNPNSGPGLIFETLPIAFGNMAGGWLVGTLFFIMLVFAALSSSIALIEPAVTWLIENKGLSRQQACLQSGIAAWAIGLITVFSFNSWSEFKIFGLTCFELFDYLTANIMLPLGGLAIAVFAGWFMKQQHSQEELDLPDPQHYTIWYLLIRFIAPAAVFLVFLDAIGVL